MASIHTRQETSHTEMYKETDLDEIGCHNNDVLRHPNTNSSGRTIGY